MKVGLWSVVALFLALLPAGISQASQQPRALPGAEIASGIEFVKIAPGSFQMGCSPGDSECDDLEKPAHRVTISKGFELGKFEVTQAQWQAVMGTNPSGFKGDTLPVEAVSWNDVQDFLKKLNARNDGYRYRLPTEAEWEYAARAGTTGPNAGKLDAVAWYGDNSGNKPHPVGEKQANGWGLCDMQGNVWEWVEDWHGAYTAASATDPKGPATGGWKVQRGGSWGYISWYARVSDRVHNAPSNRSLTFGVRVAREAIT